MSKSYEYKSGKVGNLVYQRNRFGMICYPRFIPANPRTEKQVTVRSYLATVSGYWRLLSDFERLLWAMAGKKQRSRSRIGRRVPLNGFNCFMRVNLRRLNRGGTLVERPEEDGKWQMADGKWQMADGKWQMANGRWQMADGRWQMAKGRWERQTRNEKRGLGRWFNGVATVLLRWHTGVPTVS